MKWLKFSGETVARSSGGNPVISTLLVGLFYIMFSVVEATVERLIFGERFEHWLDPLFSLCFIAYSAYCVYACALLNSGNYDK